MTAAAPCLAACASTAAGWGAARLWSIPQDPYAAIVAGLDFDELCQLDAACRALGALNSRQGGPWQLLWQRARVLELAPEPPAPPSAWKARCRDLLLEASALEDIDSEWALSCRGYLRADLLCRFPELGVYVEVAGCGEVGNLIFGIRGGREGINSLLFLPEQGLAQEICAVPAGGGSGRQTTAGAPAPDELRRIRTQFTQPLLSTQALYGRPFRGRAGIYLAGGRVAFFRRCDRGEERGGAPWESSGLIDGPGWAQGGRLSVYVGGPGLSAAARRPPVARFRCGPPIPPGAGGGLPRRGEAARRALGP